jgi:UDP-N-acetylmuramyl pentapeptide synthase
MKDTLKTLVTRMLIWEACEALKKHKPTIIMIAGSVGKTSTKDAVASVLAKKFTVRQSQKSFNSDIGVPLTILGLENAWSNPLGWTLNLVKGYRVARGGNFPEVLVLEVGADHPGDIKQMMKWLKPHASVVTSFPDTPVHVEFFSSREALWDEDAEVIRALRKDGILVASGDDKNLARYLSSSLAPFITYGITERATVRGNFVQPYQEGGVVCGMEMKVEYKSNAFPLRMEGILGPQLCYSALAAIALGTYFGISLMDSIEAVTESERPKGRMRIFAGTNNSTLIDDTYNSSPIALEAALRALESVPAQGKKIVLLGDMRELGGYSVTEHRKMGLLAGNIADIVIAVGGEAKELAESAKGKKAQVVEWYESATDAGKAILPRIGKGDVVLLKGSQGVRMERCTEMLLGDKKDSKNLPRQEREWKKR